MRIPKPTPPNPPSASTAQSREWFVLGCCRGVATPPTPSYPRSPARQGGRPRTGPLARLPGPEDNVVIARDTLPEGTLLELEGHGAADRRVNRGTAAGYGCPSDLCRVLGEERGCFGCSPSLEPHCLEGGWPIGCLLFLPAVWWCGLIFFWAGAK